MKFLLAQSVKMGMRSLLDSVFFVALLYQVALVVAILRMYVLAVLVTRPTIYCQALAICVILPWRAVPFALMLKLAHNAQILLTLW